MKVCVGENFVGASNSYVTLCKSYRFDIRDTYSSHWMSLYHAQLIFFVRYQAQLHRIPEESNRKLKTEQNKSGTNPKRSREEADGQRRRMSAIVSNGGRLSTVKTEGIADQKG